MVSRLINVELMRKPAYPSPVLSKVGLTYPSPPRSVASRCHHLARQKWWAPASDTRASHRQDVVCVIGIPGRWTPTGPVRHTGNLELRGRREPDRAAIVPGIGRGRGLAHPGHEMDSVVPVVVQSLQVAVITLSRPIGIPNTSIRCVSDADGPIGGHGPRRIWIIRDLASRWRADSRCGCSSPPAARFETPSGGAEQKPG